jgi:WD40 repeat protein
MAMTPGGGGVLSEGFSALEVLGAGSVIAGYQLEEQVGAGGMAVVYRARDLRLGRLVALKVLGPGLAADEGFRRRFIAESRAAAVVDDPHIIPVYEAGEAGGVLFIAMRFVPGGDLRRVLAREGPLPPDRAAGLISQVASALDAAHRAGLVHRDVKPANVLVDAHQGRPDHVYLSDFGVSKGTISPVSLTRTGQFLGTPRYAAPEQVQGPATDGRADQYALACVACELLTGQAPFERDHGLAVLLAHLSEPPPPLSALRPDLPAAVDAVLARALAKEPEQRYASCREFADALRDALGVAPYAAALGPVPKPCTMTADRGTPATVMDTATANTHMLTAGYGVPSPRRPRRVRILVIALASVVLTAAAAAVPLVLADAKPPAKPPARTSPLTAVLTDPASNGVTSVAFGPGGTTLATGGQNGSTYLWDTATRKITATLTHPDRSGVTSVAFGPGGTTLATGSQDGSTYLWDTATGKITTALTDPASDVTSVAFRPGGTTLATSDPGSDFDGSTYLWDTATRKITATLTDPASGGAGTSVAFGPDGTTLATSDQNGSTYLWNTATRKITATLTAPASNGVTSMAFGPDGTTLATSDQDGSTYLWDTATRKITATLADPASNGVTSVAFGPDGTTLATSDGNGKAYLWRIARHNP